MEKERCNYCGYKIYPASPQYYNGVPYCSESCIRLAKGESDDKYFLEFSEDSLKEHHKTQD